MSKFVVFLLVLYQALAVLDAGVPPVGESPTYDDEEEAEMDSYSQKSNSNHQDLLRELAKIVRNLQIPAQRRFEFRGMTNEFAYVTQSAVYALNDVIFTVKNDNTRKRLTEIAEDLGELAHEILDEVYSDVETLKKCLASVMDEASCVVEKIVKILQNKGRDEVIVINQLKQLIYELAFSALKFKHQALMMKKTLREISTDFDSLEAALFKAIQDVRNSPKLANHIIRMAFDVEAGEILAIIKLADYIEISPDNRNVQLAREVSKGLEANSNSFQNLANSNGNTAQLIRDFVRDAKIAFNLFRRLAQFDTRTGDILGELYVRDILFGALTLANIHIEELHHLNVKT